MNPKEFDFKNLKNLVNNFDYFFFLFKYFLFFKNFNRLFFLNFLFFKNFSKNNLYYFDKNLLSFVNTFGFLKKRLFRRRRTLRKIMVRNYSRKLISIFPRRGKNNFSDFKKIKRFFRKKNRSSFIFTKKYRRSLLNYHLEYRKRLKRKRFSGLKLIRVRRGQKMSFNLKKYLLFFEKKKSFNDFFKNKSAVLKYNSGWLSMDDDFFKIKNWVEKRDIDGYVKKFKKLKKLRAKLRKKGVKIQYSFFKFKNPNAFLSTDLKKKSLFSKIRLRRSTNQSKDKKKFSKRERIIFHKRRGESFFKFEKRLRTNLLRFFKNSIGLDLHLNYLIGFLDKFIFRNNVLMRLSKRLKLGIKKRFFYFSKKNILYRICSVLWVLNNKLIFRLFRRNFFRKTIIAHFNLFFNRLLSDTIEFDLKKFSINCVDYFFNIDEFLTKHRCDIHDEFFLNVFSYFESLHSKKQPINDVFFLIQFNSVADYVINHVVCFDFFKDLFNYHSSGAYVFFKKNSFYFKKKFFFKFYNSLKNVFVLKKKTKKKKSLVKSTWRTHVRRLRHAQASKKCNRKILKKRFCVVNSNQINSDFTNTNNKVQTTNSSVLLVHFFNILKKWTNNLLLKRADIPNISIFDNFFRHNDVYYFDNNYSKYFIFEFNVVMANSSPIVRRKFLGDRLLANLDGSIFEKNSILLLSNTQPSGQDRVLKQPSLIKISSKNLKKKTTRCGELEFNKFIEFYKRILSKPLFGFNRKISFLRQKDIFRTNFIKERRKEKEKKKTLKSSKNLIIRFLKNFEIFYKPKFENKFNSESKSGFNDFYNRTLIWGEPSTYMTYHDIYLECSFVCGDWFKDDINSTFYAESVFVDFTEQLFNRIFCPNELALVFLSKVGDNSSLSFNHCEKFFFMFCNPIDYDIHLMTTHKQLFSKKLLIKKYKNIFRKKYHLDFFKKYIYYNFSVFFKRRFMWSFFTQSSYSNSFFMSFLNKNWFLSRSLREVRTPSRMRFLGFQKAVQTVYTNKTPALYFHDSIKDFVFKKLQGQKIPIFFKFLSLYIIPALQSVVSQRLSFRVRPIKKLRNSIKSVLNFMFSEKRHFQARIGRGFFFNEMLEILYLTFSQKDLNFLKRWFLLTMERIQFKKHRQFLSVFRSTLTRFGDFLILKNNVKGFFLDVRGKVGVTGDAKKRNVYISIGKHSKTTKNSKYDYQSGVVRTHTGQLGITMILYY